MIGRTTSTTTKKAGVGFKQGLNNPVPYNKPTTINKIAAPSIMDSTNIPVASANFASLIIRSSSQKKTEQ
jgi:hypothetical protein